MRPFAVGIAVATSGFMDTFSRRRRLFGTAAWLWVVLAAGLQGQSSGSRAAWPIPDAPADLRPAIARADAIIAAMHDALLWELNSGLQQGGATLAIQSCHIDSDRVAQRVGREEGVAAGRTSDRLRNPTNAPKSWAAPLVTANAGRRAKDVAGFAVDLGEETGHPQAHRGAAEMCRLPWTGRQVHHRRPRGAQGSVSGRPRRRLQRRRHPGVVLGRDTEAGR